MVSTNAIPSTALSAYFCFHKFRLFVSSECLYLHLDDLRSAKVECHIEGCTKRIRDKVIREFLSNDKLKLYDKLCLSPNVVKCLIKDCPFVIAREGSNDRFLCPICGQPNCISCGRIHDNNIHCASIQNYKENMYEKAAYPNILKYRKDSVLKNLEDNELIPNNEGFDCSICVSFILPRKGISLRNCMHNFCRSCLKTYTLSVDNINNMNCPLEECVRPLTERECAYLIGEEKLQHLSLDILKPIMYNCQTPECKGIWDFASYTGQYKCRLCGIFNCASCQDIHEGQTCEEFMKTARYKNAQKLKKDLGERQKIHCKSCKAMIIKNKKCNALRCPNCRLQVCAYSGQEIGPKGCKCTKSKRCVEGCNPGCIPEGRTPYEIRLKEFFYNN